MVIESNKITYEEFLKIERNEENLLEYINGQTYELPHPSLEHQRIVTKLSIEFGNYFKGSKCEHFIAPFDVVFENENEIHKVKPDIAVICEKDGLNKDNYKGVPSLIIEVLSSSTSLKDYTKKNGFIYEIWSSRVLDC